MKIMAEKIPYVSTGKTGILHPTQILHLQKFILSIWTTCFNREKNFNRQIRSILALVVLFSLLVPFVSLNSCGTLSKENYRSSWNNLLTPVVNQVRDNSDPVNFYFLICSHQIIAKKKMLSNNPSESLQNMGRNSPEEQTRLSSVNPVEITMEIAEDGNKIDIASSHQEVPAAMSLGEAAQVVQLLDFQNHTSPKVNNQMEITTPNSNSTNEEPQTQNGQEKVLRFPSRRVSVVSASSRKLETSTPSHDPHSNGQIQGGTTLPASLRILSQFPIAESREVGKSQNPTEALQKQSSTHSRGVEKLLSFATTKPSTPEGTDNSTNRYSVVTNVDPTAKSTSSTGPHPGQSLRGPISTEATQPTSSFSMEFSPFPPGSMGGILPQAPDFSPHRPPDGPRSPTGTFPPMFSSHNDSPLSPYPSQPRTSPTHRQGPTPTKRASPNSPDRPRSAHFSNSIHNSASGSMHVSQTAHHTVNVYGSPNGSLLVDSPARQQRGKTSRTETPKATQGQDLEDQDEKRLDQLEYDGRLARFQFSERQIGEEVLAAVRAKTQSDIINQHPSVLASVVLTELGKVRLANRRNRSLVSQMTGLTGKQNHTLRSWIPADFDATQTRSLSGRLSTVALDEFLILEQYEMVREPWFAEMLSSASKDPPTLPRHTARPKVQEPGLPMFTEEPYIGTAELFDPGSSVTMAPFLVLHGLGQNDAGEGGQFRPATVREVVAHLGLQAQLAVTVEEAMANPLNWSKIPVDNSGVYGDPGRVANDRQSLSLPLKDNTLFTSTGAPGTAPRLSAMWSSLQRTVATRSGQKEVNLGPIFICVQPWNHPASCLSKANLVAVYRPLAQDETIMQMQVRSIEKEIRRHTEGMSRETGMTPTVYCIPRPYSIKIPDDPRYWHTAVGLYVYLDPDTEDCSRAATALRERLGLSDNWVFFQDNIDGVEYDVCDEEAGLAAKPYVQVQTTPPLPLVVVVTPVATGAPWSNLVNGVCQALQLRAGHAIDIQVRRGRLAMAAAGKIPMRSRNETATCDQVWVMLSPDENCNMPMFDSAKMVHLMAQGSNDVHLTPVQYGHKLLGRGHPLRSPQKPAGQPQRSPLGTPAPSTTTRQSYASVTRRDQQVDVTRRDQQVEDVESRVILKVETMIGALITQLGAYLGPVLAARPALGPNLDGEPTMPQGFHRIHHVPPQQARPCACGCELVAGPGDACPKCRAQVAPRCINMRECHLCAHKDDLADGSVYHLTGRSLEDRSRLGYRMINVLQEREGDLQACAALTRKPHVREALMFFEEVALGQLLGSPATILRRLRELGFEPPVHPGATITQGRWTPPPTICTICMRSCQSDDKHSKCRKCGRLVHINCRGEMGFATADGWECPMCVDKDVRFHSCFLCPPSLHMDAAMLVATPTPNEVGEWVHPFCGQVFSALPLNAQEACCFCVPGRFARSWLRVICAQTDCSVTMHAACALREATRANCEILCTPQYEEAPSAGTKFGDTRPFGVICPRHIGTPQQLREPMAHPCGDFVTGFPQVQWCAMEHCDRWTTDLEGGTCQRCGKQVCPMCFLDEETGQLCSSCAADKA